MEKTLWDLTTLRHGLSVGRGGTVFQHRPHLSKHTYPLLFLEASKLRKTKTKIAKLYKVDIVIYLNRDRDNRICKDFGPGRENFENLDNSKEWKWRGLNSFLVCWSEVGPFAIPRFLLQPVFPVCIPLCHFHFLLYLSHRFLLPLTSCNTQLTFA